MINTILHFHNLFFNLKTINGNEQCISILKKYEFKVITCVPWNKDIIPYT